MPDRKGVVAWFTGLSGSGKSTIARAIAGRMVQCGLTVEVVDGDELRQHLSAGLGFSRRDREENIRRAARLAEELARRCDYVLVALIAPYRAIRAEVASRLPQYREIFVNAPLSVCEGRDPKGLYRRARSGQLKHFTGVDDPYEPPLRPDLECRTGEESVENSVHKVMSLLTGGQAGQAGQAGEESVAVPAAKGVAVAVGPNRGHATWVLL